MDLEVHKFLEFIEFLWLLDVLILTSPANGLHAFTLDQWVAWQWLHIDNLWLFHAWCMSGDGP